MSEPQIYRFLIKLRSGGSLVASAFCSAEEIENAKANDRFTIDADGFGYVYRPPSRRIVQE